MRKQTKVWTTKEGKKIRICDMEDSHLLNCIRFLERVTQKKESVLISAGYSMSCLITGEQAQLDIDNGLRQLEEDGLDPSEEFPIYDNLILETKRRNLEIFGGR